MKKNNAAIAALQTRFPEQSANEIISSLLSSRKSDQEVKLQEVMASFREEDIRSLIRASILENIGQYFPKEINALVKISKGKDKSYLNEQFFKMVQSPEEVVEDIIGFDAKLYHLLGNKKTRTEYREALKNFAIEPNNSQDLEKFLLAHPPILKFLHSNLSNLQNIARNKTIKGLSLVKEAENYIAPSEKNQLLQNNLGEDLTKKLLQINKALTNTLFALAQDILINPDTFSGFLHEENPALKAFCKEEIYRDLQEPINHEAKYRAYISSSAYQFLSKTRDFDLLSERETMSTFSSPDCSKFIGFFHDNLDFFKAAVAEIDNRILEVSFLKEKQSIMFMCALDIAPQAFVDLLSQRVTADHKPMMEILLPEIQKNEYFLDQLLWSLQNNDFKEFLSKNLNGLKFLSSNAENLKTLIDAVPEKDLKDFLKVRSEGYSRNDSSSDDKKTPKSTLNTKSVGSVKKELGSREDGLSH